MRFVQDRGGSFASLLMTPLESLELQGRDNLTCSTNGGGGLANQRRRPCRPRDDTYLLVLLHRRGEDGPLEELDALVAAAVVVLVHAHAGRFLEEEVRADGRGLELHALLAV